MSVIDELNHPGAQELLRTQPLVRVAYPGPDGVRALADRPQVALTIDTEVPPHRAPLIRGVATRSVHERMAWIAFEPRWARYYDFVGPRVPAFLLKLGQS